MGLADLVQNPSATTKRSRTGRRPPTGAGTSPSGSTPTSGQRHRTRRMVPSNGTEMIRPTRRSTSSCRVRCGPPFPAWWQRATTVRSRPLACPQNGQS